MKIHRNRVKWICLFLIAIIPIISYGYNDTIFLIRHGLNVWGSIFEGDGLLSFYMYNHMDVLNSEKLGYLACDAMYEFPIYAIMAVWDLPLWIVQNLTGMDVAATWWGILWGKTLFVVFLVYGAYLIKKICLEIGIEEEKSVWAGVIYLTSLITFSSVYIIGQCDTIGIAFGLLGIYYYLKGANKRFLLFFSIAISMKLFVMVVFLVLVLLKEKRILYILRDLVAGIGVTIVSKLLFFGNVQKSSFSGDFLVKILNNKLPVSTAGTVPVSVVLVGLVLVCCYLTKAYSNKKMVCYSMLALFGLFISYQSTPYVWMYLAPFVSILLVFDNIYQKETVVLATVGEAALVLSHMLYFYWCYDVDKVNRTVIGQIFGMASYEEESFSIRYFTGNQISNMISGCLTAAFIVAMVGMMAAKMIRKAGESISEKEWNNAMYVRIVFNTIIAYVPLVFYVVNRIMNVM